MSHRQPDADSSSVKSQCPPCQPCCRTSHCATQQPARDLQPAHPPAEMSLKFLSTDSATPSSEATARSTSGK